MHALHPRLHTVSQLSKMWRKRASTPAQLRMLQAEEQPAKKRSRQSARFQRPGLLESLARPKFPLNCSQLYAKSKQQDGMSKAFACLHAFADANVQVHTRQGIVQVSCLAAGRG